MSINLKKGKASDISIVLGRNFKENPEPHSKLFEMLKTNDFAFQYSDKETEKYSIQLLLSSGSKGDKSKSKGAVTGGSENIDSKKKENFDINNLLLKYSFQPKTKSKDEPKVKAPLPGDYKLRLYLIYINSSNIHDLVRCFDRLQETHDPEVKYIFLLEGIQDHVASREMKSKKQKQTFMLSQQMGSQMIIERDEMSIEEDVIDTREKLDEFLVNLSLESQMDYKLTSNTDETMDFVKNCIASVIGSKYKSDLGQFDTKGQSHTAVSLYAGFEDFYSLSWIEMLMTIPGISEDKAITVAKQYPTMKSLMEAVEANKNGLVLEDLKVVHKYDESKAKRLGPAASTKISKLMTSENSNDVI